MSDDDHGISLATLRLPLRNIVLVGVAAMLAVSLLRFVDFDQTWLFALVPLAPFAWLCGLVLLGALSGRRIFIGSLSLAVVAYGVALPGTILPRTGCDVSSETEPAGIVVLSHNLLVSNTQLAAVRSQISELDPDVIVLQEVSRLFRDELLPELAAEYSHSIYERNQALLSRWPLVDRRVVTVAVPGTKPMLIGTVESPAGSLRLANFHSDPPFEAELRANQQQQFEFIADDLAAEKIELLIGDFNAPSSDKRYRTLRSSGFSDAHRQAGCGTGVTWSPLGSMGPAMLSLDHALLADTLTAESFEVLGFAGSDHKAIAVRVALDS